MNNLIAAKLKVLRKSQRMTQQAAADKVGVTRSTWSNYELGRRAPDIRTLQKIADAFNVGLDYFGVSTADEVLELLARAKEVFESDIVKKETKEELYKEFMKLYLNIK